MNLRDELSSYQNNNISPFFDKQVSTGIKGIAAVMIMLGHFMSGAPWYLSILFPGQCWVGIFFFYSGFGLQIKIKEQLFDEKYLLRKIKSILIPFWVAETIYTISYILLEEGGQSLSNILLGCIGIRLYNTSLWYVIEIFVLYIVFFAVNKLRLSSIIWVLFYFLWLIIAVILDSGTWWYISTSTFILGIFSANMCTYSNKNIYNKKSLEMVICTVFCILYVLKQTIQYQLVSVSFIRIGYILTALDLVIIPLFVIVIVILSKKIKEALCMHVCVVLGRSSYHIYLCHMFVYLWVNALVDNFIIGVMVSVSLTLTMSMGMYYWKNIKFRSKI